jgi:hypothetical protein
MADQPSGSQEPVTAVSLDGGINAAAVIAYRASLQAGRPLSERKLAGQFGKTSRRWARSRMAEARQSPALTGSASLDLSGLLSLVVVDGDLGHRAGLGGHAHAAFSIPVIGQPRPSSA